MKAQMRNISLNAEISSFSFSLLLGLVHVVDILEADDHLLAVRLQLRHLGPDPLQLLRGEVTSSLGRHRSRRQSSEAAFPRVVVGGVLPDGGGLDVAPGEDGVVEHPHPLLPLQQRLQLLHHRPLEGGQVRGHPVERHRVCLRLEPGAGQRLVDVPLEVVQALLQGGEIRGGHKLSHLLPELRVPI